MKDKKVSIFTVIRRLGPLYLKSAPGLSAILIVLGLTMAFAMAMQTLTTQRFFDKATDFASGGLGWGPVLWALAAMAAAVIGFQVINGAINFLPDVIFPRVIRAINRLIFRKCSAIKPESFEDTDILDGINKATKGIETAVFLLMLVITISTFYIPYFIFMGWYLFSLQPLLALSIVAVFIPTLFTQLIRVKVFSKLEDESAPLRREYDYLESCVISREYFKETRLLGAFGWFSRELKGILAALHKVQTKANVKTGLLELSMRLVTILGYLAILWMLFTFFMSGEISAGAFAAVFASMGQLYGVMEEIVCRHIGTISQNAGSVGNIIKLLDMPEREGSEPAPENGDIRFDNVSFSYPGSDKKALDGVSLTLHKGETLAVVGENGSGKSTLVRLMTGMYAPTEGAVSRGGIDLARVRSDELFRGVSAVFQKYQRYQMTLRDNLTISDPDAGEEGARLDEACSQADVERESAAYPEGYDTMLSREFDGVDLSGGQWQRVAIARGLYRPAELIILDEPTAAIDPYEETRIYNRFARLAHDRTAVIVTHRLGSVKLADRVAVMSGGKLVQCGSHEELMREDGEYARLWRVQEQWYAEDVPAGV